MNEEVRAASARPTLKISAMAGKRSPKEFLKSTFENLRALNDTGNDGPESILEKGDHEGGRNNGPCQKTPIRLPTAHPEILQKVKIYQKVTCGPDLWPESLLRARVHKVSQTTFLFWLFSSCTDRTSLNFHQNGPTFREKS